MSTKKKNTEIQGLRFVAIATVLIYHIWPSFLPGGFIGVDIFFVISGFLITGILVKDLEQYGRINYRKFYDRRIRRLMPAAGAVIMWVIIFHGIFPPLYQTQIFKESIASTFFYQNWQLAYSAVDYLDADNVPGPLQHFWSLSVEEQYYLLWPLLLVAITSFFVRKKKSIKKKTIRNFLILMTIGSLMYSIYESYANPAFAYFNFFTRMWELGIGSILAVTVLWKNFSQRIYHVIGLIGVLMIVAGILLIDRSDAFPGYIALLPVIGCVMIIIYSQIQKTSKIIDVILNNRFAQYVGDISYSLYLWHWPLVILLMQGEFENSIVMGVVVVMLAIVIAHFSKVYIEDVFRSTKGWKSLAIIIACAAFMPFIIAKNMTSITHFMEGHGLMQKSGDAEFEYKISLAKENKSQIYVDGCYAAAGSTEIVPCVYGNTEAQKKIIVVGDSHAMHWLPTITEFGERYKYRVIPLNKTACAIGYIESVQKSDARRADCIEWNKKLIEEINATDADLILMSQSTGHKAFDVEKDESSNILASGIQEFVRDITIDAKVVLIKDTPRFPEDIPTCLSKNKGQYETCHAQRKDVIDLDSLPDPLVIAAKNLDVPLLDMTDEICDEELCYVFDHENIFWRDYHHMTESFAKQLSPSFSQKLNTIISTQQ